MAFPLTEAEHNFIEQRIQDIPELIVAAAIKYNDIVVFKERPGRHGDVINFHGRGNGEHGFVTSRGRFVDRNEAATIVEHTWHASVRKMPGYLPALYSEDMWHDTSKEGPFISQADKDIYVKGVEESRSRKQNT